MTYEKISNSNLINGSYSVIGCRIDKKGAAFFMSHAFKSVANGGICTW